jgi:predicted negative regulator of RcsB-dependent stress response
MTKDNNSQTNTPFEQLLFEAKDSLEKGNYSYTRKILKKLSLKTKDPELQKEISKLLLAVSIDPWLVYTWLFCLAFFLFIFFIFVL